MSAWRVVNCSLTCVGFVERLSWLDETAFSVAIISLSDHPVAVDAWWAIFRKFYVDRVGTFDAQPLLAIPSLSPGH